MWKIDENFNNDDCRILNLEVEVGKIGDIIILLGLDTHILDDIVVMWGFHYPEGCGEIYTSSITVPIFKKDEATVLSKYIGLDGVVDAFVMIP